MKTKLIYKLFLAITMTAIIAAELVSALNTGWLSPSSDEGGSWSHEEYAYSSNNKYASASSDSDNSVVYYDFDIPTIPSDADIEGIEVRIEGYTSDERQATVDLSYNGGSSYTSGSLGDKTTDLPVGSSRQEYETLGDSQDTWNRDWSTDDFKNSKFQVRLTENNDDGTLYIDHIQVRVHYTTDTDTIDADEDNCVKSDRCAFRNRQSNYRVQRFKPIPMQNYDCFNQDNWQYRRVPHYTYHLIDNTRAFYYRPQIRWV